MNKNNRLDLNNWLHSIQGAVADSEARVRGMDKKHAIWAATFGRHLFYHFTGPGWRGIKELFLPTRQSPPGGFLVQIRNFNGKQHGLLYVVWCDNVITMVLYSHLYVSLCVGNELD